MMIGGRLADHLDNAAEFLQAFHRDLAVFLRGHDGVFHRRHMEHGDPRFRDDVQMIQRITTANLEGATLTVEEGVDMPLEATGVESLFLTITAGKIQRTAILTME